MNEKIYMPKWNNTLHTNLIKIYKNFLTYNRPLINKDNNLATVAHITSL